METFQVKLNVDDVEEKLEDDALTEAFCRAVRESIEEGFKMGIPAPMYDGERGQSYRLYPDGRKVYE